MNNRQSTWESNVAMAAPWKPMMWMKMGSRTAFKIVDTSIATA